MKKISICYASDDCFAMQMGVSMYSLFANNTHFNIINVYVLDNGISEKNKKNIRSIAEKYNREIFFIDVDRMEKKLDKKKVGAYGDNLSYSAYLRIFLPELLPLEVTRILYLDCDTIVTGKLDFFLKEETSNYSFMGVSDIVNNQYKKIMGINTKQTFYNSGVLYINLEFWRKEDYTKKILWHLKNVFGEYPCADQEPINIICGKEAIRIPLRYNYQSGIYGYRVCGMNFCAGEKRFTQKELSEAQNAPVIIHYNINYLGRPWEKNNLNKLSNVWNKYYKCTVWGTEDLVKKKIPFTMCIMRYLYYLSGKYSVYIHGIANRVYCNKLKHNLFTKLERK